MQINNYKYDFSKSYKENEREWLKNKPLNLSNVIAKRRFSETYGDIAGMDAIIKKSDDDSMKRFARIMLRKSKKKHLGDSYKEESEKIDINESFMEKIFFGSQERD